MLQCTNCGNACDGAMTDGHDNPFCSDRCYYTFHRVQYKDQLDLPLQGDPGDEDPPIPDFRLDLE